ncbi:MAG: tail fiber domain-containing protein [bacterium]
MPVQGVLTTLDGAAIAGRLPVDFALYTVAEGGEAIWQERQDVDFDRGFFSAQLGAVEPLGAALFAAHDVVWLGVTVDDDDEMTRIELGTAPFAAFAVHAGDAATIDGRAAESFAAAEHRHDWSALDGVPAGLADGDDDTTYDVAPGGGLELSDGAFALLSGCGEGELLKRGDGGWLCAVDATGASIAAFGLDGTVLGVTEGDATWSVDLAALATDLDASNELLQGIGLEGAVLRVSDAGGVHTVDLASLVDDADADPTNEANTDLTLDGTTLAVTDGVSTLTVDLASLVDDADADPTNEANVDLSFDGTTLAVTDVAGTLSVDLSSLVDDADADPTNEANTELTLTGTTLAVTDAVGTLSVDLASLVDDADADPSNELQDLSLAGDTLSLSASGVQVDLSAYRDNTDAQTLSVDGTALSVSGGNTVSLASLQDDLGSHQATRNLALDGFWVSFDGTDSGVYVDATGAVGIGTSQPAAALDVVGDVHVDQAIVATANQARAAAIDAANTTVNRVYTPNANTRIWQSFTMSATGLVTQVQVHLDSEPITGGVLEIYMGEGTGGTLLLTQDFVDEGSGRRTIVLDTPVAVSAGEQYTLRLTNTAAGWRWRFNQADVYAGGRASTNANEDMDFRIYVTGDPVLVGMDDTGAISVADGAISVDVNGQVGIGTSAPAYALQVGEAGDGTEARANAWNVFSDARLKTDVKPITDPLARLDAIGGYTYAWKAGSDRRRQAGVIAQEVEAVLPEVVSVDANGLRAVDYGKLNALLIEAVKAQQRLIEAQGAELDALRAENEEIREVLGLP